MPSEPAARLQRRLPDSIDAAEIFIHGQKSLQVRSKDMQVEALDRAMTTGVAIRLEKDQRHGFAYSTDLSDQALDSMIRLATSSLTTTEPKNAQCLPSDWAATAPDVEAFDSGLGARSVQEKIDKVIALEKSARDFDRRISQVRMSTYEEQEDDYYIWNSRAGERSCRHTLCQLHLMAMAEEGTSQESAWNMGFSPYFDRLAHEPVACEAAEEAVGLLHAGAIPTGNYTAVLHHGVVAQCLGILAPSFLAESVQKKKSKLAGKRGHSIYSPYVSLFDDGLYPEGTQTAPFDAEGVSSQTTLLVAEGVLQGYLYDTISGLIDGSSSTGNSMRENFKDSPRSGTRNFYLKPGAEAPVTLYAGIQEGVAIHDVIGIHTANPITGDFSVGAAGYRIRCGRREEPVRGFAISGNLHDMLAETECVADDLKFYGSVGAPSIRISRLEVGGT